MHKTKQGENNPIASIKREIKKKSTEHNSAVEVNTSSETGENESLFPKIEQPSSYAVSSSGNDSSDSSSLLGNRTLISHFPLRLLFFKITDSRVPLTVTIPHLAPFLLQILGSRPSNKPNPGSRKTYRGPSSIAI